MQKIIESSTDKVISYILNGIKTEKLKPGSKLPGQYKIASELGVARGCVREAMQALKIVNIITILHGKNAFINNLTPELIISPIKISIPLNQKYLKDLTNLRINLESMAITSAIKKLTLEDIKELEKIINLMEFYKTGEQLEEYLKNDLAFHLKIFEIADNPLNKVIYEFVDSCIRLNRFFTIVDIQGHFNRHKKIFERIVEKDIKRALKQSSKNYNISLKSQINILK